MTRREAATIGAIALFACLAGGVTIALRRAGTSAPAWFTASAEVFRIDVNSAGAATLGLLPGVGPAKAQAIIDARESGGPFRDAGGLDLRVPGIGPVLARRLAPHVRFGSGQPPR